MAAERRARNRALSELFVVSLLQAVPTFAETHCTSQEQCTPQGTSWTSLWYVWLILLTVFLLLICGIGASCVKFCCRKKRPPVQTFPPHSHDLTIIPMDHDSTAHSTITSYSSIQFPQSLPLPLPFQEVDINTQSPPAYSLYAIEMPPSYEEAIKMGKPHIETPFVGQKLDASASESAAHEDQGQTQTVPESNSRTEELQESSEAVGASTQETPYI
uniref:Transmembrane protein 52 n=1 Tax=Salvator merianae TaxID=96440 RepID=A0A8D0BS72_SALMN